jgi:hypothetical protein
VTIRHQRLVERYAPLIWSICRRHRLDDADVTDVSQSVWLHLADHLDNPAANRQVAGDE